MSLRDTFKTGLADIAAAQMLLTRIPAGIMAPPRAEAAWAWPVAGLIVALPSTICALLAMKAGLPSGPAAALLLTLQALLTGGLHEDGLSDSADGLLGGRDKTRRLEIMKDSRIGSHGALALGLVLLLRWTAMAALLAAGFWGAVVAVAMLSRAAMAAMIATLPNARGTGLSQSMGAVPQSAAVVAVGLSLLLSIPLAGTATLPMAIAAAATALVFGTYAKAKIGGQTGDILGATQQLTEAAMLLVAAATIAA